MTQSAYVLLGLTAMVAALVAVLTFAVLKFVAGARQARRHLRADGGPEGDFVSSALEEAIARLKQQEAAMSARAVASERLSSQIVESLTAGLLVVGGTGRVEILNPAAHRLLRVGAAEPGADYRDLLKAAPALREVMEECLATRQPIVRRSVQMDTPDGPVHFGVSVSPLGDARDPAAICLFSDLTNVIELEEQLRLKETLARLGELTAGLAHEFRNGLATIHGYSRLLAPEGLPAAYRPYVLAIRQETETLGQVVTNFLNFARPEKPLLAPVALEPLIRRATDELRHELPAAATIDISGEFGRILGDEVLLRQMFGNLLRNAVEACETAGIRPQVVIEGRVDQGRRTCRITVSDNGPGIPEGDRARVFQPFFTTRSRGTGLGLSVVQKIVVMHNGRVAIGASPAGGACVDVSFPAA
ncbi:MAG: hypothetical protein A3F70_15665 [Acidobacteria bacterium RIFCSPLOWO2_12_FULL_67_14]|nr:MAG: hypothetical protein A3H29_03285 [Acidobacteria bacterium RIFCSPLOWO2_02_FULL_67_21]OFW35323.1 MAG: hypothetical protein A3F70_15665 [Acidobacteria bacterium RIFCSPLOWO2_12_FULL_67_14]